MAKLSQLGVQMLVAQVLFTGEFEESSITNADGETYMIGKLKHPINARCSMDNAFEPVEVDELYLSKELMEADVWEGNPQEGLYIPGYKVDFSKNLAVALYQSETIRQWVRGQRGERKEKNNQTLAEKIKALRERKQPSSEGKPEVVAHEAPKGS